MRALLALPLAAAVVAFSASAVAQAPGAGVGILVTRRRESAPALAGATQLVGTAALHLQCWLFKFWRYIYMLRLAMQI